MTTPTFVLLIVCFASIAVADDFKTINGKEYKNATVSRVEPDGIVVKTKSGISKIYFTELPKEVQQRFGYDAAKIEAANAAARAAEAKRIEQEKEREENAEADLKRSVEEFQAAEQRASKAYQSATKGTLSGQVFVASGEGVNFKLGAVQLRLFAREAIDNLLVGIKNYAEYKIQQLSEPVAEAKAAFDQAEASESAARDAVIQADSAISKGYAMGIVNRDAERERNAAKEAAASRRETVKAAQNRYSELDNKLSVYYSGAFYFEFLKSSIQTAETDADGKFVIQVPRTGAFVIAAQAGHYYWLQPVLLEGQQQRVQNLSNSNLTSTTGTSSLIHTQD